MIRMEQIVEIERARSISDGVGVTEGSSSTDCGVVAEIDGNGSDKAGSESIRIRFLYRIRNLGAISKENEESKRAKREMI